ncbi:peroxidasin homolog pxn-1-like [Babylonia areolata]|uniref:peroxidasin homolog pxn-1-like n=1 Tax=Babylonia areolata TaxID=304850 RepID=UPI003FD41008
MNFARSVAAKRKRDCDRNAPKEIRQQLNMLTAWIDASQVYGSTLKRADGLRVYRNGLLKVVQNNMLPEDTNSTCVKEEAGDYCFMAGEKRANEHAALMALHIVFHRYHNEMALKLARLNPRWSDERIYQEARRVIGAIMQHVTYHDWLPVILGPDVMRAYSLNVLSPGNSGPSVWRYNSKLDPTILNAFATAAFRFGHTMVPSLFTMGDSQVRLFTMFNRPKFILQHGGQGLRKMCSGMIHDPAQASSLRMVQDLSDRLFEDRHNVSMDLGSLNIHRGRDHGLPPYLHYRELCGLQVYSSFEEMYRTEPYRSQTLMQVYEDVRDVDLFVGALSERPLPGSVVGPTFACLMARQFHSLKFADRFWYEAPDGPAAFTRDQLREIRKVTLGRIVCRTTSMPTVATNPLYQSGVSLPSGVLLPGGVYLTRNQNISCGALPEIDFRHWYDPDAQA